MPLERSLERELVRKCREGASRFYEPLVRAYEEPALRVAAGMLGGDRDRARDAVQDAFVRAWEGLDGYDPDRPFAPWFFGILRNRCRDLARSEGARSERERRAGRESISADGLGRDGRRREERREARRRVWNALERISGEHREVLVLRELEGLSYAEIAEILDVPEGTVASRLYHARDALRQALEASP